MYTHNSLRGAFASLVVAQLCNQTCSQMVNSALVVAVLAVVVAFTFLESFKPGHILAKSVHSVLTLKNHFSGNDAQPFK